MITTMPATTPEPTTLSVADDPRWARIVARDKTADGHLWYSVSTTGVYCRPSCPSRIANPKNVQLHDTLESAKATGFRPCRRCNPDGPSIEAENAGLVTKACRAKKSRRWRNSHTRSAEAQAISIACSRPSQG
jgi:AraC family transcriptional regulator, regulatory protein of adaptative response / methylated-DNA-[protein]-cysteine methyltransferase